MLEHSLFNSSEQFFFAPKTEIPKAEKIDLRKVPILDSRAFAPLTKEQRFPVIVGPIEYRKVASFSKEASDLRDDPSSRRLVECDLASVGNLVNECILSSGDLSVHRRIEKSIAIAGGDIRAASRSARATCSILVAAGDILFEESYVPRSAVLVCGGEIRVLMPPTDSAFVAPKSVSIQKNGQHRQHLFLHGQRQPSPDFFFFRDLWADYGMEASAEKAGVRITKIKADSTFAKHFKVDDVIEGRKGKTITSVGHFRRLVGHCLDLGELEFDVRRNGEAMKLAAKLPKRDWKGK